MIGSGRQVEPITHRERDGFGARRQPEDDRAALDDEDLIVVVSVDGVALAGTVRPGVGVWASRGRQATLEVCLGHFGTPLGGSELAAALSEGATGASVAGSSDARAEPVVASESAPSASATRSPVDCTKRSADARRHFSSASS